MSVSQLRVGKSETRDLADRERIASLVLGEPSEWHASNAKVFGVFVALAALATVIIMLVRL